ncbi:MAG: recombinase family protein [Lachnospiraceae bacterium]|nr:recombinase family protein [Lachnospiraceae bacterium]
MARKSRQQHQINTWNGYDPIRPENVRPVNRTAIYARLSYMDDSRKDSIQTQVALLEAYLEKHPDLHLAGKYVDNGYTGTNFNRPQFKRLLNDMESGAVNCIIIKDLSRFGRNYIEAGYYLETVLPAYHVQLIAVNDGFDMDTSSADELSIILKNLLNDFYSRDLSRRFSDSYDLRVASGVFRHGLPYGYTYDKDRPAYMTYDKKVYHIVKLIFQWGLEGVSVSGIASRLNKMGLSPSDSGTRCNYGYLQQHHEWTFDTVSFILSDPVYAGDFITGKSYDRKCDPFRKRTMIPQEEWKVIPDTHPAYISREDYEKLQTMLHPQANRKNIPIKAELLEKEAFHLYKGVLYCSVCHVKINLKYGVSSSGKHCLSYRCRGDAQQTHAGHASFTLRKPVLDAFVLAELQKHTVSATQFKEWLSSDEGVWQCRSYLNLLQSELDTLAQQVLALNHAIADAYESHADGMITANTLSEQLSSLRLQRTMLENQEEEKARELKDAKAALSQGNPWVTIFAAAPFPTKLNRDLIQRMISRIEIGPNEAVWIEIREKAMMELSTAIYQRCQSKSAALPLTVGAGSVKQKEEKIL